MYCLCQYRRKPDEQRDVRVKLTSVCCKSMLAKGLRGGAWLDAVPFVSFTGLSGGGVASWGIGLKLLCVVRFLCITGSVEAYYSGSLSRSNKRWSWRRVSLRCCAVAWPLISSFRMPTALLAAVCWSGVKVDGGVGGSAAGNGMISDAVSWLRRQVRERCVGRHYLWVKAYH
jgi:hypothetical protein